MSKGLDGKRIILVGGPGGVGKTTLAASLAIRLASEGHRTVVLTVDPARRLAQALGFTKFEQDLQEVPLPDGAGKGKLFASMLDTQRYLDKVVERFATKPEQREKILRNPLYQIMVESLGGTAEYAAMERLLEFIERKEFDKIIVDTPPSQNALDLLTAPQRLAEFMDNKVLRWFQGGSPKYLSFFKQGTKLVMKLLQRIFGAEFLTRVSELLDDIEGMQGGFRQRHLEVLSLLKSPQAAFFLVTTAAEDRYEEAMDFVATLKQKDIPLAGLWINQLTPPVPAQLPERLEIDSGSRTELDALLSYQHSLFTVERQWVEKFALSLPTLSRALIERCPEPPSDVVGLSKLSAFLVP